MARLVNHTENGPYEVPGRYRIADLRLRMRTFEEQTILRWVA